MPRPDATEFAPFYRGYTHLVPEDDVLTAMRTEGDKTAAFLRGVPEVEAVRLHPPFTWTVRQVVGHLTDAERVFGYRALRFARGDTTPLPGFDENTYAAAADVSRVPLADLAAEFESLRRSHVYLFGRLAPADWDRRGEANGQAVSVRALAYIMVGHERHHAAILRRRLGAA